MVHHVTKIEEVTFLVHEIAILKHPQTLLTHDEWRKYAKLTSSYIRHRQKVFLVVRRFDEWRNHSYVRDHECETTLYDPSTGWEMYKDGNFTLFQEAEEVNGDDEDDDFGIFNDYERETIELNREIADLEHPNARIELQLMWAPTLEGSQDEQCTEAQITSPYVLKLNDFVARNAACCNAGEVAFEVEHTDREVELSFRQPLESAEYHFRKIRIFFHENEEMQDFLSRIDILIGVRRSRIGLRIFQNKEQEQNETQISVKTEERENMHHYPLKQRMRERRSLRLGRRFRKH